MIGQNIVVLLLAATSTASLVRAGAVASEGPVSSLGAGNLAAHFDSPALRLVSDEDMDMMKVIKHHIEEDFAGLRTFDEVNVFLDKVKLMVQKHPKNVAFAKDDLKDLHKFLTQDIITRLIRVDTEPFVLPIDDERMPIAQRAVEEDELTRKLFGFPLRSLIEAKKQQASRSDSGNPRDGNFFSNLWCKVSGSCPASMIVSLVTFDKIIKQQQGQASHYGAPYNRDNFV